MRFAKPDLNSLVLCISALIFISLGSRNALHSSIDFVPVYTGARCLLHGCNPYEASQLDQQYVQAGGRAGELPAWDNEILVYPPSTFLALSPLALLRISVARVIWFLLNGCSFVTSAVLILSMCPRSHRWLATALVSIILASSGILLELGNPAIFAISLLIIGSYLFLRGRFLPLGALSLMLSLAVKPQMGCLVVLYLLASGIHRRYAAVALAGALAVFLSAGLILKMNPRSADWTSDLSANISAAVDVGGINDPRPANEISVCDINLQAITSIFFADAREFNAAAYAVFLALLAVWITAIVRTKAGPDMHLLSIASLAVLSLTPIYHRFYDTRMLLITIPAVVIVFQKRRYLGAIIGVLSVLALISVQSRVQAFLLHHAMWQSILPHKFLFVLLLRQQNLELLILFCLYMFALFSIRFRGAPAMATADSTQ